MSGNRVGRGRTMQAQAGRRRRAAALIVVGAVAAGIGPGPLAGAQAAPAAVTLSASDGTVVTATDCRGRTRTEVSEPMSFTLERAGDTTNDLSIDVSYSGTLAGSLDTAPPDPVVIPAGDASVTVEVADEQAGTLVLTVEPAATYVATPTQAEAQNLPVIADLGCNLIENAVERTVLVGSTPEPVDVDRFGTVEPGSTFEIDGGLPPGLGYEADGTWTGVATQVGSTTFDTYYCDATDFCSQRITVTVHVVPIDAPPPPPAAPPAAPVHAQATLTG